MVALEDVKAEPGECLLVYVEIESGNRRRWTELGVAPVHRINQRRARGRGGER